MTDAVKWAGVASIVAAATAGDVLQSSAMKRLGDLGELRRAQGIPMTLRRIITCRRFMLGFVFMALAFFCLLITLSWADVSVAGPASASLTFIANAFAARIFLKERVDHRRWLAAFFVAGGVALLAR